MMKRIPRFISDFNICISSFVEKWNSIRYTVNRRVARFCACVSQALTKMVEAFAVPSCMPVVFVSV